MLLQAPIRVQAIKMGKTLQEGSIDVPTPEPAPESQPNDPGEPAVSYK